MDQTVADECGICWWDNWSHWCNWVYLLYCCLRSKFHTYCFTGYLQIQKSFAENFKAFRAICRQLNDSSSDGTLECLRKRSQHLKGTPTSAMLHYHDLGLRSFGREEVEDRRDRHSWQRRLFVVIPLYLYSLVFTPIELWWMPQHMYQIDGVNLLNFWLLTGVLCAVCSPSPPRGAQKHPRNRLFTTLR